MLNNLPEKQKYSDSCARVILTLFIADYSYILRATIVSIIIHFLLVRHALGMPLLVLKRTVSLKRIRHNAIHYNIIIIYTIYSQETL
jgi:hypothetical protein